MILFTTMLIIALIAVVCSIIAIISGGVVTLALFGDVIVCGLLIWIIVKLLMRKKKK